jgi:hypothetical protein
VSAALYSHSTVSDGHIMCGSSLYMQTVDGANTAQPLTPASNPEWLDASTSADIFTCYTDAYEPLHRS